MLPLPMMRSVPKASPTPRVESAETTNVSTPETTGEGEGEDDQAGGSTPSGSLKTDQVCGFKAYYDRMQAAPAPTIPLWMDYFDTHNSAIREYIRGGHDLTAALCDRLLEASREHFSRAAASFPHSDAKS